MREQQAEKHLKEVAKIDDEIEQITQEMKFTQLSIEQQTILAQRRKDLAATKEKAKKPEMVRPVEFDLYSAGEDLKPAQNKHSRQNITTLPPKQKISDGTRSNLEEHLKKAVDHNKSSSKTEWQRLKDQENAINPAIDDIMEMVGLDDVKVQVLGIRSKVETSKRQGTDLKRERLGLTLLGNPGTGEFLSVIFLYCC